AGVANVKAAKVIIMSVSGCVFKAKIRYSRMTVGEAVPWRKNVVISRNWDRAQAANYSACWPRSFGTAFPAHFPHIADLACCMLGKPGPLVLSKAPDAVSTRCIDARLRIRLHAHGIALSD